MSQFNEVTAGQGRSCDDKVTVVITITAAVFGIGITVVMQLDFWMEFLELREEMRRELLQESHEISDVKLLNSSVAFDKTSLSGMKVLADITPPSSKMAASMSLTLLAISNVVCNKYLDNITHIPS